MDNLKELLSTPTWYYPEFKKISGSVNAALILQRLIYWWSKKLGKYVYKTVSDLKIEMDLSKDMQLLAIKELEKRKLVDVLYIGMPARRHFKVNHDEIRKSLAKLQCVSKDVDNQQMSDDPTHVGKPDILCRESRHLMSGKPTSYVGKPDNKMSGNPTRNTITTTITTTSTTTNNTTKCEKELSQGSKTKKEDSKKKKDLKIEQNKKKNPPNSVQPPLNKKTGLTLHGKLKNIFMEYFVENGGQQYYWTGKDGKHMKELIEKIEFLMKSEGMILTDEAIIEQFRVIIENIKDEWILNNFSVSILNTKFNEIVLKIKRYKDGKATGDTQCCTSEAFKREVYERLLGKQV